MKKILFAALAAGFLSGCAQKEADYKQLQEKTQIEQQQQSKVEVEVLNQRAQEMERDLQRKYRFFQALKNVYTGTFKSGDIEYGVKLEMIPSLSLYQSGRIRTIEEVTQDLNSLYLNSQIVIWNLKSKLSAGGCIFQETKPDLILGQIALVNRECANLYSIQIGDGQGILDNPNTNSISKELSQKLLVGELEQIDELLVFMQPTNNAQSQQFVLKRQ